MCTDLRDTSFEVLCEAITQDKTDIVYAETVRDKPTINNSGFTNY